MIKLLNKTRCHDLSITSRGKIDISARVVRILELHSGDIVGLYEIDRDLCISRLYKSEELNAKHRCCVHPTSGKRGTFRLWSVDITKKIFDAAGCSNNTLRLACGEPKSIDNKIYIPIITKLKL